MKVKKGKLKRLVIKLIKISENLLHIIIKKKKKFFII